MNILFLAWLLARCLAALLLVGCLFLLAVAALVYVAGFFFGRANSREVFDGR